MKSLIFLFIVYKYGLCTAARKNSWKNSETSTSDFSSIVKTPYFVDKTELIVDLFSKPRGLINFFSGEGRYIRITAPRGFGKSTNMDMVRRFFEVQVFPNGTRIPKEETDNYKLFTQNNLRIHDPRHGSIFPNHFGEYPVLFLDFKKLDGQSYSKFLLSFKLLVHALSKKHRYLLKSDGLDEYDKEEFNYSYSRKNIFNACEVVLKSDVTELPSYMYKHLKKRVIVLIDDYDAPIQDAIFHAGTDTSDIIYFMRQFIYRLLSHNEFIELALINVCVKFSNKVVEGVYSIDECLFTEKHPYKLYYGFTDDEVINLTKKCNCESQMESIREWYGGYNVQNSKTKLYNAFSVVQFMRSRKFQNYWVEKYYSLNLQNICLHDRVYTNIMSLLIYNYTNIGANKILRTDHIENLRNLITNPTNVDLVLDANQFLRLMLDLGYFTILKYPDYTDADRFITIPNFEILSEIRRNLTSLKFLELKFNASETDVIAYMESILNLGKEKRTYEEFLKNGRRLFQKLPRNDELEFQLEFESPLFAIPFSRQNKHSIRIYYEGFTSSDFLIIREKDHTGIIIEIIHSISDGYTSYESLCEIVEENSYYEIFNEAEYKVKSMIIIVIYLNVKGECSLSYLFNTTDINKAVTLIKHNTGVKWSEERKKAHSERMKEYWRKRKEQQRKKQ